MRKLPLGPTAFGRVALITLASLTAQVVGLCAATLPSDAAEPAAAGKATIRPAFAGPPSAPGLPPREPMKAEVLHQKVDDGLAIEEVAYLWAERAYAFAHTLRPGDAKGRLPALVVVPGRLGHYTRPAACAEWVRRVAQRGYLVLFIVDPHTGKRNAPEAGLHAVASAAGTSVSNIRMFDALRAMDYLRTRTDVDPQRVAIVGFDEGAIPAAMAARYDRGLKLVAGLKTAELPAAAPALLARVEQRLQQRPQRAGAPAPCGKPENPDFSMLRYMQRRLAAAARAPTASPGDANARREARLRWLAATCRDRAGDAGPVKRVSRSAQDGLVVETLELPQVGRAALPCRLVYQDTPGASRRPAVLFSHDGRQCVRSPEMVDAAARIASRGFVVVLPEHASPNPASLRPIAQDALADFYAKCEDSGDSPLAQRVREDLTAFRLLAGRADVASDRIVAAGQGLGAIDACLTALLEPKVAGVVSLDATTLRDWAAQAAPEEESFFSIMPFLPAMPPGVDWDCCYAALAPRPLVLAKLKDGWPKSGFAQVAAAVTASYGAAGGAASLVVVSPREPLEEREKQLPEGIVRQCLAVARTVLPAPPAPGVIGSRELLKPRSIIDSATGVVWLVHVLGGVEQEFIDGGYRIDKWSFFSDRATERGRRVTPLIFKKEGDGYRLVAIGKTRSNSAEGLQTFPFEPVAGNDAVAAGCFFGFYTGDPAGKPEAGVVPFEDGPQDRMTILSVDGGLDQQKVSVGQLYRENSSYPRTYSIEAVSVKKPPK